MTYSISKVFVTYHGSLECEINYNYNYNYDCFHTHCLINSHFILQLWENLFQLNITLIVTSLRTIYNMMSKDEILKRRHNIAYRIHTMYMEYIHTWQTLILYSCILHFPQFYAFFHGSSQIPIRRMLHIPRPYVSQLHTVPEFPLYFPSSNCWMCPSLFMCHRFLLRFVICVWHSKASNISLQSP